MTRRFLLAATGGDVLASDIAELSESADSELSDEEEDSGSSDPFSTGLNSSAPELM